MIFYNGGVQDVIYSREIGRRVRLGTGTDIRRRLYSSIQCTKSWDSANDSCCHKEHGSIFNFDFSLDGSLLVAACERKSILVFDPFNGQLLQTKNNAHADCVNCVRFLDSRTFATCSDDTTVCIWDVRYLKHNVRTLHGHSNWVKNIDFDHKSNLLMTSGFDGCIYTWDINRYSDSDVPSCQRIFHTNGLMRSKLSPDGTKLIMATANGYLMVIHDLDLTRLPDDLAGFKPDMYRNMQLGHTQPRLGYTDNHLFMRRRNRVELISDFPLQDSAEMISSLEVHPHGWCVASRNTTFDETSEWTCVHDIQGVTADYVLEDKTTRPIPARSRPSTNYQIDNILPHHLSVDMVPNMVQLSRHSRYELRNHAEQSNNTSSLQPNAHNSDFTISIRVTPEQHDDAESSESDAESSEDSFDSTTVSSSTDSTSESFSGDGYPPVTPNDHGSSLNLSFSENSLPTTSGRSVFFLRSINQAGHSLYINDYTIHQNVPRLKHYIEEPNVGRGFIKELCFSQDGRLICSPFGYGIRLLAFDSRCSELSDCVPECSVMLHEITSNMSHVREVVTCKFSPRHCLVVSGCLNGKVDFHQPVL